jgi:hypothetical protein
MAANGSHFLICSARLVKTLFEAREASLDAAVEDIAADLNAHAAD